MRAPLKKRWLDIVGLIASIAGGIGFFWFLSRKEFGPAIISGMFFGLGLIAMQATIPSDRAKKEPNKSLEPTSTRTP
jgi:hypothetical protein